MRTLDTPTPGHAPKSEVDQRAKGRHPVRCLCRVLYILKLCHFADHECPACGPNSVQLESPTSRCQVQSASASSGRYNMCVHSCVTTSVFRLQIVPASVIGSPLRLDNLTPHTATRPRQFLIKAPLHLPHSSSERGGVAAVRSREARGE